MPLSRLFLATLRISFAVEPGLDLVEALAVFEFTGKEGSDSLASPVVEQCVLAVVECAGIEPAGLREGEAAPPRLAADAVLPGLLRRGDHCSSRGRRGTTFRDFMYLSRASACRIKASPSERNRSATISS